MMSPIQDEMALTDQEKLDQQTPTYNAGESGYNPDGSGVANDFHKSPLPQSAWPPGMNVGGQFSVHRDTLTAVSNQMKNDLTDLQNSLNNLYGNGAGGATLGGWDTADGIGNNSGQAYYGISTYHQDLNNVVDQMIGYLKQTTQNYADAEDASTTAASNVGNNA
jgi:hypothetical protein